MSEPAPGPPAPAPGGAQHEPPRRGGWFAFWQETPLYLRILAGVLLGVIVGLTAGERAAVLELPSRLVLRVLAALAPPLILFAVVQALMHAQIPGRKGGRLVWLLVLNTLVAITIGLLVANVLRPGAGATVELAEAGEAHGSGEAKPDPLSQFLENIPRSVLGPLGDKGSVLAVVMLALAFGIALRRFKDEPVGTVAQFVDVAFRTFIVILHWVIEVIPVAVFGIVASIVGTQGFGAFVRLGWFVLSVLIALALQATYYLVRIQFWSWVGVGQVLRGTRDALVMAFSTASSTATMPVTYAALRTRVGLREQSASLGALVGANFNNDGTALYEAMAALFVSQLLGMELSLAQQFIVVVTSVVASVGAAGIPEAGIVTLTLVLKAVGIPNEMIAKFIPLLLTVDWFLDRCRTAINVMGDVNVSCLLDGRERERAETPPPPELARVES